VDTWFEALEACANVKQHPVWHPEGSVLAHSMQIFKWACRESDDHDLVVAALLHDVGKAVNPLGHAEIGVEILGDTISEKTAWLIRNHMRFWDFVEGNMKRLKKVHELRDHMWLPELVMLARWDKLGRNPNTIVNYSRAFILLNIERSRATSVKINKNIS